MDQSLLKVRVKAAYQGIGNLNLLTAVRSQQPTCSNPSLVSGNGQGQWPTNKSGDWAKSVCVLGLYIPI